MKKLLFLIITLLFSTSHSLAQDNITLSDSLVSWNYNWVASLNGSQASYSNWAQGGVDNISGLASSKLTAKYREGRYAYGFQLATRYGRSRIEGQGTRKTDDRLSIRNRFLYDLTVGGEYSLYGDAHFRTQFDEGFEYDVGPEGEDVLISRFMSPAYFSQSAGLAYTPGDYFSFDAGPALKQTIVTDEDLQPVYNMDEGQTLRNEAGFALSASYEQSIMPDFLLSTSVETFTNLGRSFDRTDVNFSSELTGKVNEIINTSLRLDLAYNDDFSDEIQVQQILSLGISFMLI